jgi:hypothetical protein
MLALIVVVATGVFFIGLGTACWVVPVRVKALLIGFASTPGKHLLEVLLRLVAGAAFVLHAPQMAFPELFRIFGGVLLVTTAGLLLLPWQWHRRFTELTVPRVTEYLAWIGLGACLLGLFVLVAALRGIAIG